MFQIQCLQSTTNKTTELYSKYSIGPFLKGQSTTVGNALRRILLSNLQGTAITGVRIIGIDHEFSTIPNVKEDVIEILLNLKQIIFKGTVSSPTLAKLVIKEPGVIVASNIDLPSNISLVDPQQYIASLTDKGNLEMEFLSWYWELVQHFRMKLKKDLDRLHNLVKVLYHFFLFRSLHLHVSIFFGELCILS